MSVEVDGTIIAHPSTVMEALRTVVVRLAVDTDIDHLRFNS
jgi:hypothetical protein